MKPYKFAIFDMDGTLTDTMRFWRVDVPQCVKKLGFEGTVAEMHAILRDTVYNIPTVDENAEVTADSEKLQAAYNEIVATLDRLYKTAVIKPKMYDMLCELKSEGIRMCVATATARPQVELSLKSAGIDGFFEFLVCAGDYPMGKTTPELFNGILSRFGAAANQTAVFEDALYSIKTAKKMGFYIVGVEDEYAKHNKDEIKTLCDEYIAMP